MEPKEPLKKIKEEDIKINPELAKKLMKELDQVEDGNRLKRLNEIINEIEQMKAEAKKLQKSENIDFDTAFDKVMLKKKRAI